MWVSLPLKPLRTKPKSYTSSSFRLTLNHSLVNGERATMSVKNPIQIQIVSSSLNPLLRPPVLLQWQVLFLSAFIHKSQSSPCPIFAGVMSHLLSLWVCLHSVAAEEKDLWVEGYKIYMVAIFRGNWTPFKLSSHAQIFLRRLRHTADCLACPSEWLYLKWSNHCPFKTTLTLSSVILLLSLVVKTNWTQIKLNHNATRLSSI